MNGLRNSKQHIKIQKDTSYAYYKNQSVKFSSFWEFIKIFFLLSNIFSINCSMTENEKKDTIDHLYRQLINLGNLSYEQHIIEFKKLKNTKVFAFNEVDENNTRITFGKKDFKLFEYISTDSYNEGAYITCVFLEEGCKYKNNVTHTITNFLIDLRRQIKTNRCRKFNEGKSLPKYERSHMITIDPIFLKKESFPIFFEKIADFIQKMPQKYTDGFILLTNHVFSDLEISVVLDHMFSLRKSIIWIFKDEIFIDPLTYISYNVELSEINLNFILYDFGNLILTCSDSNKKSIRIKRYHKYIDEKFYHQVYTSLEFDYYSFFLFTFDNETIEIHNGFINTSLSKQESNNLKFNFKRLDENQYDICSFSVDLYFSHRPYVIYIFSKIKTKEIVYTTGITNSSDKFGLIYEYNLDKKVFLNLILVIVFYFAEEGIVFEAHVCLMLFLGHRGRNVGFIEDHFMVTSDKHIKSFYFCRTKILVDRVKTFIHLNKHNFVFSVNNILNDENILIRELRPKNDKICFSQFYKGQKENENYNKMIKEGDKFIFIFDTILNKQEIRLNDIESLGKFSRMAPAINFYLNITDKKTKENLIILIMVSYMPCFKKIHIAAYLKKKVLSNDLITIQKEFINMFEHLMSDLKKDRPTFDFNF